MTVDRLSTIKLAPESAIIRPLPLKVAQGPRLTAGALFVATSLPVGIRVRRLGPGLEPRCLSSGLLFSLRTLIEVIGSLLVLDREIEHFLPGTWETALVGNQTQLASKFPVMPAI